MGADTLGGQTAAASDEDLLKMAAVKRYQATGNVSVALVVGVGPRRQATVSPVAYDRHNAALTAGEDVGMLAAKLGGQVAVGEGEISGSVPFAVAVLMSGQSLEGV